MPDARVRPFGEWISPLTAEAVCGGTLSAEGCSLDGGTALWTEGRPAQGGGSVVVRYDDATGRIEDVTPPSFDVRSRVHEYGGGASLCAGGEVFFVNRDQRLYRQTGAGDPVALTPAGPDRFADPENDSRRGRLICVRERHGGPAHPVNDLVAVAASGGVPRTLASGRDFYAAPRLSPDGRTLAWLAWNLPSMPWHGTTLWRAPVLPGGDLGDAARVAGGPGESVLQPEWAADGTLHFVSDRSGWWNLYRQAGGGIEALCPEAAEFGRPMWQFGMRTYGFAGDRLIAMRCRDGLWSLGTVADGRFAAFDLPYNDFSSLALSADTALFVAAAAAEPAQVVRLALSTGAARVLRRSAPGVPVAGYLSAPEPVTFPTADDAVAHGFFYPPANRDFAGPAGALPPLLVRLHGGPTGATSPGCSPALQYWTSRGLAVLDLNYRGSTGYGRAYREALDGRWGVADVADCVAGARFLADRGRVDGDRMAIRGSSAGGYTALAALTFSDAFRAGASLYGIGDLEALAADTHKFESRYLDRLVGPYPERRDLYVARSPLRHADSLRCPVIFFQGLDDRVVPPGQAEAMVASLRSRGVPVAYVPFAGEGHGFRDAVNRRRALEAELYFYGRVLGFEPADSIEPVEISGTG